MTVMQIQPRYAERGEWDALALREGLRYELIEPFYAPCEPEGGRVAQMLEWYAAGGLVSSIHGAFMDVNPASGDEGFRALSRLRCEQSCDIAKRTGALRVVLHSSCCTFLRGGYLDGWAAKSAEYYVQLSERYDISICIENSQDTDPGPLEALMKRANDRRISVCLDIGHANYSRAPLAEWFDRLGERIGYLHLSDNAGLFDDHLPLGSGTVDWGEADALWRQLGRDTHLTLEVGGMDGVMSSLGYLAERGYFGRGI